MDDDWFIRADGSMVPVAYSSAPFQGPSGRAAVVVFRDMTARLAAEQARLLAEAERAQSRELAASRRRLVEAADAERRRLGRDLHDGAQQRLVNVVIALQMALAEPAAPDDDPARELVSGALERRARRSRSCASSRPACIPRSSSTAGCARRSSR